MKFCASVIFLLLVSVWVSPAAAQGLSPLPPIRQNLPNVSHKDFSSENHRFLADKRIKHIKGALNIRPEQESYWDAFCNNYREYEVTSLNHNAETLIVNARGIDPTERIKINARQKREIADRQEDLAHAISRLLPVLDAVQKRKLFSFLPKAIKSV